MDRQERLNKVGCNCPFLFATDRNLFMKLQKLCSPYFITNASKVVVNIL